MLDKRRKGDLVSCLVLDLFFVTLRITFISCKFYETDSKCSIGIQFMVRGERNWFLHINLIEHTVRIYSVVYRFTKFVGYVTFSILMIPLQELVSN